MRMRIILPKVWESKTFGGVSWDARFMLVGLWSYCDDEGRGLDATALIAATLFPFDLQNDPTETYRRTAAALDELAAAKLIWRYQVHDENYLQVLDWGDWQQPRRPTASRIPTGPGYEPSSMPADDPDTCAADGCDRKLGALRIDAKFCSDACRQRAYRYRSRYTGRNAPNFGESEDVTDDGDENADQSTRYDKFGNLPEDSPSNYELRTTDTNYELRRESGRATRLRDGWQPTPDVVAQMRSDHPHIDLEYQLKKFSAFWHAKAGKDAMKHDWNAAFIYWICTATEQRSPNGHRSPNTGQQSAQERKKAIAADVFKALGNQPPNRPELT